MAIPQHTPPAVNFTVTTNFPLFPALTNSATANMEIFGKWWNDVQIVLQRNFSQVTTQISSNSDDIITLEASALSPSNPPPGVTVGTTPVDQWFSVIYNGRAYLLPGWLSR